MAVSDPAADWFDKWIDTYRHPATSIYANVWPREGANRNIIAINENGQHANIYDMERTDA